MTSTLNVRRDDEDLFVLLVALREEYPPTTTTAPPGPLLPLAPQITGSLTDLEIDGSLGALNITGSISALSIGGALPVADNDVLVIYAGEATSIPWLLNGYVLPENAQLTFSVKDPTTGVVWLTKKNEAAGGSEDDFETPAGAGELGFINLQSWDTATARVGKHWYDVIIASSDGSNPRRVASAADLILKDHASR